MRRFALFVVLVFAGAAAAQDFAPGRDGAVRIPAAETGDYHSIRRIAVVSVLGPELRVQTFAKKHEVSLTLDVSAWDADGQVRTTLKKYLATRFEIVDAPVDAAPLRDEPAMRASEILRRQRIAGVDGFLLVRPLDEPGPLGMGLRVGQGVALCANYEIDLIDARSGSILGRAVSRMQTHSATPASFACFAEELNAKAASNPSADTLDRLRTQAEILIPRSLVETLRALELGIALPPPGDHSIAPPESPAVTDGIASVSVVSAIGDIFSFSTSGSAFHAKEVVETPISDWLLDADVERTAAAVLARKFTVKPAEFDRAALLRLVLREHKRPKIEGLSPSAEVDAYVLVVKAFREGTAASGAGLWNRETFGKTTYAFVNYAIVLVDARTLKVLRAGLPAMRPNSATAYPLVPVQGTLWPEGAKDRAAAGRARPVISRLIADSLPETLYQMGLTKDDTAQ